MAASGRRAAFLNYAKRAGVAVGARTRWVWAGAKVVVLGLAPWVTLENPEPGTWAIFLFSLFLPHTDRRAGGQQNATPAPRLMPQTCREVCVLLLAAGRAPADHFAQAHRTTLCSQLAGPGKGATPGPACRSLRRARGPCARRAPYVANGANGAAGSARPAGGTSVQKTLRDYWVEPPVQSRPSFQDVGLVRTGVVENMSALGTPAQGRAQAPLQPAPAGAVAAATACCRAAAAAQPEDHHQAVKRQAEHAAAAHAAEARGRPPAGW